jgi:hypothetical protein
MPGGEDDDEDDMIEPSCLLASGVEGVGAMDRLVRLEGTL